jgi:hypothetical protein
MAYTSETRLSHAPPLADFESERALVDARRVMNDDQNEEDETNAQPTTGGDREKTIAHPTTGGLRPRGALAGLLVDSILDDDEPKDTSVTSKPAGMSVRPPAGMPASPPDSPAPPHQDEI